MALPGTLDRTPEPEGDRPAAFGVSGDVWQRQGPRGTPSWFAAVPPGTLPVSRGLFWHEVEHLDGPATPIYSPRLPEPAYTGEIPLALPEAATDPILSLT